ncbi:serine/threonine-protein phosphatase [Duganella sp. FT3S]|uniref:Serine/threonine-protein phosphatase n=1 Tax=Rugamonas fusca TaxID=2758568 RepID=A0A7W2EIP0_9BURK|nr:serine/threonine-protein phosphatase [Rugamonas fusca]
MGYFPTGGKSSSRSRFFWPGDTLDNWKQLSPSVPHRLDFGVAFGLTDIGTVRESNQDNFLIAPDLGLVMVADGMGGHNGGEIASADALNLVYNFVRAARDAPATPPGSETTVPLFRATPFDPALADPDATWSDAAMKAMITLHDAVEYANDRMYQTNLANDRADGSGMGTTLTGLWQLPPDGPMFVFHVGDSRLYRYRQGRMMQLTRDQTLYQQALDAGAPAPLPPRNLLLQALGPGPELVPELQSQVMMPGDVYLLCSDGLYGESAPGQIETILASATEDNLDACCAALVEMAKRDGCRDNITALLVKCTG